MRCWWSRRHWRCGRLYVVVEILRVSGEPPTCEPAAQEAPLRDRPRIVIEQADQGERREPPGDRAVPEMHRSRAPAATPDRDQNRHHDPDQSEPGQAELGADQEGNVV